MSLEAYFFTCVFHDKVCSNSKQGAMELYQEERRKAPENAVMNAKLYEGSNFNSGNYLFTTDTK